MQLAGDTALATAIDAPVRVIEAVFKVDWNRDGLFSHALSDLSRYVDSVRPERDLEGALPAETTLAEGFVSASMTVSLSGRRLSDGVPIARLLSPWYVAGPLYGRGRPMTRVTLDLVVRRPDGSTVTMRQFTGVITSCAVKAGDLSVTLTCRDDAENIRKPITLPIYGQFDTFTLLAPTNDYRINSHSVIDYILRQNKIYQSPPAQVGCFLSVPGHGSMLPEIGFNGGVASVLAKGACTEDHPSWVPGHYGIAQAATPQFTGSWGARCGGPFNPTPGSRWSFQFLAKFGNVDAQHPSHDGTVLWFGSSGPGSGTSVRIGLHKGAFAGFVWVAFDNDAVNIATVTGTPAVSTDAWHLVSIGVTFGSPLSASSVVFDIDGTTSTQSVSLTGLPTAPAVDRNPLAWWWAPVPVQNIQACRVTLTNFSDHWYTKTFVSQCDLDPGLNETDTLPAARGVDSWDLLKEVVQAEFGVFGFTEQGRPFFRNRDTVRRQNLSVEKQITAVKALKDVTLTENAEGIRNAIAVTAARRWINKGSSVFKADGVDDFNVPPGLNEYTLFMREPAQVQGGQQFASANTAAWNTFEATTLGGFLANNPFTNADTGGVFVAVYPNADNLSFNVAINNTNTYPIRFCTTDGKPAFRIVGFTVGDGPATEQVYRRQSSIDAYGERALDLKGSAWAQRHRFMQPVALGLLKDLKRAVAVLDRFPIVGDPRLQLGDTVELDDPDGLGGPTLATVVSIVRSFETGEGLTDQLGVLPFAAAGTWILGHPTRSVLGLTTILG